MPDFPRPFAENGSDAHYDPATRYSIRRKGSVYNIVGPDGRVFAKYKSASVVGPRWEELTETPWPYPSSAYEPGTRLWQLGLIDRNDVGKTDLSVTPEKPKRAHVRLDDAPEPLPASQAVDEAAQSLTAKTRPALKPLKAPARQLTLMDNPADSLAQPPAPPEPDNESLVGEPVIDKPGTGQPTADNPPAASTQVETSAPADTPARPTQPHSAQPATKPATRPTAKTSRSKAATRTPAKLPDSAPISASAPGPAATSPARKKSKSASASRAAAPTPRPVEPPATRPSVVLPVLAVLALPAPRINLDEQSRQIQTLRRSPQLLFDPKMRVVLQREVEYSRPFARWAQTLLTMLARYDKRQQRARTALDPQTILARHIAWQEEQLRGAPAAR